MEERSQQLAERASGCGGSVVRNIRRDLAEDKFSQDVDGSACAKSDERVFKCQCRAIAITGWVVKIGNAARGQASENLGIIRLPMSIVPLANHCIGNRIESPRSPTTITLIKITRILFQKRGQDGASDEGVCYKVRVGGTVSLCVPLGALPVSTEMVCRLLHPRNSSHGHESNWIHCRLQGELELLLRGERSGVGDIADIEIRKDPEHTLLLLLLDLLFCHFDSREFDLHLCDRGSNHQRDLRDDADLSGMQDSRR